MINEVIIILLLLHGLMHLFGFAKGYRIDELDQFSQTVTRSEGIVWLSVASLFIMAGITLLLGSQFWLVFAVLSIVTSQILIMKHWYDTKVGTIANVIITIVILIGLALK